MYKRQEGGDAISFVRRFFHMDFKEAVRFLLEQSAVPAAGPVQCERQEQKQLRLPPKDSSEEQVRRYLTGIRKVSADVAGYFIETGQVYQIRAEGVRQGQEQCLSLIHIYIFSLPNRNGNTAARFLPI